MRYLTLFLVLTLSTSAAAEQRGGGQRSSSRNQPTPRAEALSRNIPPRLLLPAGSDRFDSRGRVINPSTRWNKFPWWAYPGAGFAGGGYYGGGLPYYESQYEAEPSAPPANARGLLILEVTPATGLQYFGDGNYLGASSDLGLQLELNPGARRIEIRAAGYKPLVFDVRIPPGATTTFRGALERDAVPAAAIVRPAGSQTIYIIPGCYMGSSPNPTRLPKGCDVTKMITRGGA
jgi:hypothetical protein